MASIEELVACSADELEKMSDKDLLDHFSKYLDVTRPERQSLQVKKQEQQMTMNNPKLKLGLDIMKTMGIDTTGLFTPIKKRR